MNLLLLLFTAVLHLGTALEAPPSSNSLTNKIHHLRSQRRSKPLQNIETIPLPLLAVTDNITPEFQGKYYSTNWAGAVIKNPPPSATYTYISATIAVPTPTPTDNSTYQAAPAWVGIDGATHIAAIPQTGVDLYVVDGKPYTDAWYEWYPNIALYYDEFEVNPGDVIVTSVNVTASNRGVCMVENRNTGEIVSKTLLAPKSTATLAGMNAEWVVEDFHSGGNPVPFVKFDRVWFEGCATYADGDKYGLGNATVYELMQDNVMIADVRVVDADKMVVTHFAA
ncbi:hypothetical protein EYZ11_012640 [Aspergillus tanneri]|uniref:Concanavalin A-like lectin/glucanase n=1 Tax=Aspergillus tanneri TaxID=1220188 RepID=A0A4S3J538_9EURO|nr:uncharacterized protein ATNIH1004_011793 [Aspergillus tanneri]KAA8641657.1 hypothetical protein ATNIH1004_011793 [Aspergillus tanneri]THC87911.1 hypothetical protein EYZ11_012640 [Aspergillus tanneri]